MDLRERRELDKGLGDGMSRAFELVLTPMIVAALGWVVDQWAGTTPLFTIVFALWGVAATTYLAWVRYDHDMRDLERARAANGPAPRRRRARRFVEQAPGAGAVDG